MPTDTVDPATVEHKKSRKGKAIETDLGPTDTSLKEKRKKHKTNNEAVAKAVVPEHKKEKKKRKHAVEVNDDHEMEINVGSNSDSPEMTKRKRKRDNEEELAADISSAKKDKKKKRKKDVLIAEASTSMPIVSVSPLSSPADVSAFLMKHSVTIHTPPSHSISITPILSFPQLKIPSKLRAAFAEFKEPTPIQACTWPPALLGHDVIGIAETGSGKTLAFGIPALSRILTLSPEDPNSRSKEHKPKSNISTVDTLVIAPTRELALQTHDTLSKLGAPFGIASVAVFGGVDKAPQIKLLANANKDGKVTRILVGTPGRILDLVNDGTCDLSRVNYLVLDEADRMLDKGFENDVRNIISHTRPQSERQTLMFSATWPEAVRRLASTFQRDPVRVTVGSDDLTANSRVEQSVEVFDDSRSKDTRLLDRLHSLSHKKITKTGSEEARILVFALYKKEASRVEGMLRRQGYAVGALHGDMTQPARMDALDRFRNGTTGLLVATDVAARGLDIPNVGAVINYTFPLTIEDYIHRIGRTGRGGRTGKSITFFTGDAHERSLAGELARVLRESGFNTAAEALGKKFPMTIKKKTHGAYGAFFRDDIPVPTGPTKIKF